MTENENMRKWEFEVRLYIVYIFKNNGGLRNSWCYVGWVGDWSMDQRYEWSTSE